MALGEDIAGMVELESCFAVGVFESRQFGIERGSLVEFVLFGDFDGGEISLGIALLLFKDTKIFHYFNFVHNNIEYLEI